MLCSVQYCLWLPDCMALVIYVCHIASLYDCRGDATAGADMMTYNSKTALHDRTHRIDVCCSVC